MGHLSTHALDTTRGAPGAGIKRVVLRIHNNHRETVSTGSTNDDGRCDKPLLAGEAFVYSTYRGS